MRTLTRVLTVTLSLACAVAAADDSFLKDGDRIVLLGNTLIEREQEYGHWEARLLLAHPKTSLQFRNLGWSGDTVWAESRGMFDPPQLGYQRMVELVRELQPTVIIFGYGGVEAYAGEGELPRFIEQYRKLVNDVSSTETRRLHLAPPQLEASSLPRQTPQAVAFVKEHNARVVLYREAIRQIALERQDLFLDLTADRPDSRGPAWTENGIHLNEAAYAATGEILARRLAGGEPTTVGAEPYAELQRAVIDKNRLFFHRWRPQNFTYLFGFRKHEQGQNAVEIARFDPLIAAAEERITTIRDRILSARPVPASAAPK